MQQKVRIVSQFSSLEDQLFFFTCLFFFPCHFFFWLQSPPNLPQLAGDSCLPSASATLLSSISEASEEQLAVRAAFLAMRSSENCVIDARRKTHHRV